MNAVIKNHFLLYSGLLILILSIPFVGFSYSNNSPSTEVERSDTTRTNIEATPAERNRLETTDDEYRFSVYGEANVCDGVTCPDGSCAATMDECAVIETIKEDITHGEIIAPDMINTPTHDRPDYLDPDDDGDGIPTQEQVVDTATTTSTPVREITPARSPDNQNQQVEAVIETAVSAQDYNSSRSNKAGGEVKEEEDEIDASDVIRPAKNYNSSRSNRRKNSFFDPNTDEADDEANIATVPAAGEASLSNNLPTVRCGSIAARGDDDGSLWCWGSGIRATAVGEENEDGDLATSTRILHRLSVRGAEVRSWNEQERAEFRRYNELIKERTSPEAAVTTVTRLVLDNESIHEIELEGEEVSISYQAQLRLFGFIPLERNVTAHTTIEGEISISYPWYRFLARTPDTNTIESVLRSVLNSINDHRGKGGGSGKVSI